MSSLTPNWEEFKQMAKEFRLSAPTLDIDELDNAWKCLGLAYLGMTEDMWRNSAAIVLKMEMETFLTREEELLYQK